MADAATLQHLSHEVTLAVTHFNASRYMAVAGLVLLAYDHLLTLDDEIDLVWKAPTKPVACLFLFNRYVIPLVIIIDIFEKSGLARNLPDEFCIVWLFVEGFFQAACFGIAHVLVALRVRALYVQRRWVTWVLWLTGLGYFGATVPLIYLSLKQVSKGYAWSPTWNMCIGQVPHWTFWIWIPALIFETILFGLTAAKAIQHRIQDVSLPIAKMLYRDGFLYFIVITACCVFNIISWAVLPETLIVLAKYFTFSVVNVMSSRLVLNLHSLRRSEESAYWGHNTSTNTSGMELRDWPASPREYTAFPQRVSLLRAAQRRGSNGTGRRVVAQTPQTTRSSTPRSASLFIRPYERSQTLSRDVEMEVGSPQIREFSSSPVSIQNHRRDPSHANTLQVPPPVIIMIEDVDFEIEIASYYFDDAK